MLYFCTFTGLVYGLILKNEMPYDSDEAMKRLTRQGIGVRPFFHPMHQQPVFQRQGFFQGERHPIAERLARRGFYIPSGLALTEDQIRQVAEIVRTTLTVS